MGERDPAEAVSAGPKGPVTRERAVPAEPTVVVANGIAAFDEWGHALGARVADGRARAETIPAEREVPPAIGGRPTILLVAAAMLFLVAAAVLVRGTGVLGGDGEHAIASASTTVRAVPAAAAARVEPAAVVHTSAAIADAPAPPPLPETASIAPAAAAAPAPAEVEIEDLPRATPAVQRADRSERAAPRRARPATKPKRSSAGGSGEIVREMPY